jgi:hypothetical protein
MSDRKARGKSFSTLALLLFGGFFLVLDWQSRLARVAGGGRRAARARGLSRAAPGASATGGLVRKVLADAPELYGAPT